MLALLSYRKKKWRRGTKKALASNATRKVIIVEIVKSLGASQIRMDTGRTPVTEDQIWYRSGE